jgi:[ribosomal protein S5]-alanine N-acetyltransferase
MLNHTIFPCIETKNLVLRRMSYNDIGDLFEMRKDPRMSEYTDTIPDATTDETKAYIDKMNRGIDDNKWIIWAIEHKQSNKVIGSISIWNINKEKEIGELGYGVSPDYQGKGLMREALLSVIEYGLGMMNLKVLEAYTEENNTNSINLLERCNFIEFNRVEDEGYFNNRVYSMIGYRIDKII